MKKLLFPLLVAGVVAFTGGQVLNAENQTVAVSNLKLTQEIAANDAERENSTDHRRGYRRGGYRHGHHHGYRHGRGGYRGGYRGGWRCGYKADTSSAVTLPSPELAMN